MNRRRIIIGLVVLAVAFVCIVLFQPTAPDAITVRFHSIPSNRGAQCIASNANRQNFVMTIVTEQETNGAFARLPQLVQYEDWDDGPSGFIIAVIPEGPAHCRIS